MNESDFKDILAEICEEEIAELNEFPPFKPSLRHRLAMKHMFALFEKNSLSISNASQEVTALKGSHLSLRKRLIIIFVLIICAALLTGFIYGYVFGNFRGTVYNDNTQLFVINTENCPETIEYEYYLPILPNGFEMVEHDSLSFSVYTKYRNSISGQEIVLSQCTKKMFDPHYSRVAM